MFTPGVPAAVCDSPRDGRGCDTMNRLLLHGARYHDRPAAFVCENGNEMPDWKADRLTIRLALALEEMASVRAGDIVAISMPLSPEWAIAERAIWGLGAVSFPLFRTWSSSRVAAVLSETRPKVVLGDPDLGFESLLARGESLDTPERATRFRAGARAVEPSALASREPSGLLLAHAGWVHHVGRFLERVRPERGRRYVLSGTEPELESRIAVYGSWAHGLAVSVFGGEGEIHG